MQPKSKKSRTAIDIVGRRRAKSSNSSRRSKQVLQLEREELRQLVLELTSKPPGKTFGELAHGWLARVSKRRVEPENERRHIRHMAVLHELREGQLTKAAIEDALGSLLLAGQLGPATLNKLRSTGSLVLRDAQANNEWFGPDVFDLVPRFRQARLVHPTLTVPEVRRVLPHLRQDRRRESKTILLGGLRPGEVLGLLKVDVDLEQKMLKVRRSHGRNRTKNGKEREFPIPDELVPDLRAAMAEFPASPYVFPKADGTRQRHDTKLTRTLRTALKKARLVVGYRYICRRKGCGHTEERKTEDVGERCPACAFRLWISPIPKPLRFYDLRHSSATLHRKAKCDPLVVREMMGHGSKNQTDATYTHLDPDYQRIELNKLSLTRKRR